MSKQCFPKPVEPGKGLKGQNCNVTHCQAPNSANHYNKVMRAWYCIDCATRIERSAQQDGLSFYDDLESAKDA